MHASENAIKRHRERRWSGKGVEKERGAGVEEEAHRGGRVSLGNDGGSRGLGREKKNYDDPSSDSFSFFLATLKKPMDVISESRVS